MLFRYFYPVFSLADAWQWKLVLAGVLTAMLETLGRLFVMNGDMAAAVAILIVIDFATGVYRAYRSRSISSRVMRQTGIKVIEYTLLIGIATMVANVFVDTGIPFLSPALGTLGTLAFAYVCLTEMTSVFENVFGSSSKARRVWVAMKQYLAKKGIPDEIIEP
jgi:phage-related holin